MIIRLPWLVMRWPQKIFGATAEVILTAWIPSYRLEVWIKSLNSRTSLFPAMTITSWLRDASSSETVMATNDSINRREFLTRAGTTAAVMTAGMLPTQSAEPEAANAPKVKKEQIIGIQIGSI